MEGQITDSKANTMTRCNELLNLPICVWTLEYRLTRSAVQCSVKCGEWRWRHHRGIAVYYFRQLCRSPTRDRPVHACRRWTGLAHGHGHGHGGGDSERQAVPRWLGGATPLPAQVRRPTPLRSWSRSTPKIHVFFIKTYHSKKIKIIYDESIFHNEYNNVSGTCWMCITFQIIMVQI